MDTTPYQHLETRWRRIQTLNDAAGMLHWDASVMMPPGGAESRGEQLAVLKTLAHDLLTDPAITDLLDGAETDLHLDPWQQANVREMRRQWRHATALSAPLVEQLSKACSTCETVWRRARADNDFATVHPHLERVLELTREAANAKAETLGCSAYDALLDEYEPGGRSADIDVLFADLSAFLPNLLGDILERQKSRPAPIQPQGPFTLDAQRALAPKLMRAVGFDFDFGRIDESLHPFCGGTADDVRITARYDENDFASGLMAILHETGHAMYERGLPHAWRGQPVGLARSMSLHESQSLLVEMQACRSREFLSFAAPLLRDAFNGDGPAWESENLYRLATHVAPDFIRVDADEVTYPAHVILRYRLEKAAIEGQLEIKDLPGAWNDGMEELLGIRPSSDREGCLQDIHWFDGAWGYFPTYTLGAMSAAQLFQAACDANTTIPTAIARGDFSPLMAWLRENVHALGASLSTQDIMTHATGTPLATTAFKTHLQRRYQTD